MSDTEINRQIYFVGGGLGSLAGAVYLLRDCAFPGKNIHILEGMPVLGGSNDGAGNATTGFIARGGRMLNEETYENLWELLSSIPSLECEHMSVTDEILAFDHAHPTHANARLINKDHEVIDVLSMGFSDADRIALFKLMVIAEEKLDNLRISDWFINTPHFFETNFWYLWQTTFAFQKWSSLIEFKRYMHRMIFEYSRIHTLEGVTRTRYNQYESIILPLKAYLERFDVDFSLKCTVTDLDFEKGEDITVAAIRYETEEKPGLIHLNKADLCIVTNGCMTDNSRLGSLDSPAEMALDKPISATLWEKIAVQKDGLGNPRKFFGSPAETNWESFTVTLRGNRLLKLIEKFSRNKPGSGALMTFRDSNWLMSLVVAAQPHFKNQPEDITILWGYGLYTSEKGNYIEKAMRDCTGREILLELLHHLDFTEEIKEILETVVNVIPCYLPYIISMFQPRARGDRPEIVPKGSTNLAFIGQFVEIPEDMVFTEEYSVRSARLAVYSLLGLDKKICPVSPYGYDVRVLLKALTASYR